MLKRSWYRILSSQPFEFLEDWVTLSLKFLGALAVFTAVWAIQEPNTKIYESGQMALLNMRGFLSYLQSSGVKTEAIEKVFYAELNKGESFTNLIWISNVDTNQPEQCIQEREKESSTKKAESLEALKDPEQSESTFQKKMEELVEVRAGFTEESKFKNTRVEEECATQGIYSLTTLFTFKYGLSFLPFDGFKLEGTTITASKEQVQKIIKSFDLPIRKALFEYIATEQSVLTFLTLKNDGKVEARDVKVRFNFVLNTVRTIGGLTHGSTLPSWEIAKQPILVEGGTLSENRPYSAEVSYRIISGGERKWIYIVTKGQNLLPKAYSLEPPPYTSRVSPTITLWGSLFLVSTAFIRTCWKRSKGLANNKGC